MLTIEPNSPATEAELLSRAQALAGRSLSDLAQELGINLPENFQHHKGWLGQLLEINLGADGGSHAAPDFSKLGIELKTIPVSAEGRPLESTFVCAVPAKIAVCWENSLVWQKLKKVLWIPIIDAAIIPDRKIGRAVLWEPNAIEQGLLRQDWEELTEMLTLGHADQLSADYGEVLQIRPKAAHSRVLKKTVDSEGYEGWIVPRGFYLRANFTEKIVNRPYTQNR